MQGEAMRLHRRMMVVLAMLSMLSVSACSAMQKTDRAPHPRPRVDSAASGKIRYEVFIEQPQTQTLQVVMHVQGWNDDALVIAMPVWRPGKYRVLDQARSIRQISAVDQSGRTLPMAKISKAQWRIKSGGATAIAVHYELFADALRDRTLHIDDTHAFLSGESVFLYVEELRSKPTTVGFHVPATWHIATGLDAIDAENAVPAHRFAAADYDELIDSPFEIGTHERLTFEFEDKQHDIVIWGDCHYDGQRLVNNFAAIVREQTEIFGGAPYERFVFQIHCAEGFSGGTEHRHSTIMQVFPARLEGSEDNDSGYKVFLGLVSHEMFHTWNVKSFIPADLVPYDYQTENYTDLLWVVEGTTSYYDDLTLARAQLLTESEYMKRIVDQYTSYRQRPGRNLQSLAESSFDAWIKYTQPTADSTNSTVSFYRKGALVSLMLDMEIRRRTKGQASLDMVMRWLYENFPRDSSGYNSENLESLLAERFGSDFTGFLNDYVRGTVELDLNSALSVVGFELVQGDAETKDDESEPGANANADKQNEPKPYLGVHLAGNTVRSILTDGPANTAGIVVGDEIMAINGRRVRGGNIDARLKHYKPGDEIEITVFRRDTLRTVRLALVADPNVTWKIQRVAEPTDQQKANYESWMEQPWDTDASNDDAEDTK